MDSRRDKGKGHIFEQHGIYHVQVKVDGKRRSESLHVGDLRLAQVKAKEVIERLRAKIDTSDDIRVDCIDEKYKEHLPTYSKRKGAKHVEATKTQPLADKTFKMSLSILKRFREWLNKERKSVKRIRQITPIIANNYFSFLRKGKTYPKDKNGNPQKDNDGNILEDIKPLKDSSYNRHLMGLRHIFDVVPTGHNPFKNITQRTLSDVAEDTVKKARFEIDELKIMQQKAGGWIRPAMLIGFYSGLRLSDVVCLKWTDIDAGGFIKVKMRKTSKQEILYAPELMPELKAWKAVQKDTQSEYIFPEQAAAYLGIGRKPDKSRPCKQFQYFLTEICKITTTDAAGQTVKGFHSLRVSHATYSRFAGLSVEQIQKQLAHSSADITKGYIQKTDDEIKHELMMEHKPLSLLGDSVDEKKTKKQVKTLTADEKLQKVLDFLEGHKSISGKQRDELMSILKK
ncbi:MAG TPA: hypothetical protein DET40_05100 [Lentisphaeria bacterium]|nr:MAG: hypothetical protein A2X45_13675 [Lentisphaerae bacterium GWF2_50_93]HCE42904.1 hypothetical protein [Lentisphaeria bacterium]